MSKTEDMAMNYANSSNWYSKEIKELQTKLDRIEKKCLKEQKKSTGIYDWRGELKYVNRESAKFAKSILRIINKAK